MIAGRRWLVLTALAAVVLLEIGGAWYLYSAVRDRLRGQSVGDAADFPPSTEPYRVGPPGAPAMYLANTSGTLVAFVPFETNDSVVCRVEWLADGAVFRDPCLGATYTLEGRRCDGPAARNLDRFRLEIVGRQVWVNTAVEIMGDPAVREADGSLRADCP